MRSSVRRNLIGCVIDPMRLAKGRLRLQRQGSTGTRFRRAPLSSVCLQMPAAPQDLKRAVKLFNRWQFEEAVVAFHTLAEAHQGRDREFLEALSQLSGGFHRIWHKGGESSAMVALVERSRATLTAFAPSHLGLDLRRLDTELASCLAEAIAWRRGDTELFNRDVIPRLEHLPEP